MDGSAPCAPHALTMSCQWRLIVPVEALAAERCEARSAGGAAHSRTFCLDGELTETQSFVSNCLLCKQIKLHLHLNKNCLGSYHRLRPLRPTYPQPQVGPSTWHATASTCPAKRTKNPHEAPWPISVPAEVGPAGGASGGQVMPRAWPVAAEGKQTVRWRGRGQR